MNKKILMKLIEVAEEQGISLEELDDEIYEKRGRLAEISAAECGEVSADGLYRIAKYLGADLNELLAQEIDTLCVLEELSVFDFLGKLKELTLKKIVGWNRCGLEDEEEEYEYSNPEIKGIYIATLPSKTKVKIYETDIISNRAILFLCRDDQKNWTEITSSRELSMKGSEYMFGQLELLLFEIKKNFIPSEEKQKMLKKEIAEMSEYYRDVCDYRDGKIDKFAFSL